MILEDLRLSIDINIKLYWSLCVIHILVLIHKPHNISADMIHRPCYSFFVFICMYFLYFCSWHCVLVYWELLKSEFKFIVCVNKCVKVSIFHTFRKTGISVIGNHTLHFFNNGLRSLDEKILYLFSLLFVAYYLLFAIITSWRGSMESVFIVWAAFIPKIEQPCFECVWSL